MSREIILIFFFSSRRRHTRWPRDWSSDVCSSDLVAHVEVKRLHWHPHPEDGYKELSRWRRRIRWRSEERRVGKECRSQRSRYIYNKTQKLTLSDIYYVSKNYLHNARLTNDCFGIK